MSRARIVCSEILNRMSPVHHFDEKPYAALNLSQEKAFNLSVSGSSSGEEFIENSDVSCVLSDMNTTVDDWLRHKTTCAPIDCIDAGYLHDVNFLSTKDPDMCPSTEIGYDLVLVDDKKESNLNYCSLSEKSTDLDQADPLLNLIPMNEVLLRKTESKCDNLLSGKDLYVSDGDRDKGRSMWDTLSLASRRSDCDVETTGDFSDFNLLPFPFDSNDHISALEPIGENTLKTDTHDSSKTVQCDKTEVNSAKIVESCDTNRNKTIPNEYVCRKTSTTSNNIKKATSVKRPNILRTSKSKPSDADSDISKVFNSNLNKEIKTVDKNMNIDIFSSINNSENESVFDFVSDTFVPSSDTEFTITDELDSSLAFPVPTTAPGEEKKFEISDINNMTGSVAIVSNEKARTKIVIRTDAGEEKYEGNTADLMESLRPGAPLEGEHIVTSVRTAATEGERKQKQEQDAGAVCAPQEPEDCLVRQMLAVLGISDEMLYTVLTNLGLRVWVCPELGCRRLFNRLNTLKCHILSHYGLKPFKCDFPGCPWSFYTSFKLKRHRETHLKRKDFVCTVPDCKRTFTTVYNLNTHLKLHERPARLKCLVRSCSARFQTRRAMETHLKTHEISLAPYKCPHPGCNKPYFSCSALTAHSRCHQHKEEELRCQWPDCGRLFDKPCRLKAHMRQHTGDKPYVCKFKDCKWAFASSSKLKRHQYKHNNERKFRCTIGDCTKAFMRSEHLREHTFTHIAQRTFQCSICGEKCSAKATLYVHKKKFHPNENPRKSSYSFVTNVQSITSSKSQICDQSNAHSSSEGESPTVFIKLLPNNKGCQLEQQSIKIEDVNGAEYQANLADVTDSNHLCNTASQLIQINAQNSIAQNADIMSTATKSKSKVVRKSKVTAKTNSMRKSCARTYLPYLDGLKKPCPRPASTVTSLTTSTNVSLSSTPDVLLNAELLSNNQETICLSNLMLHDDAGTTELYSEDGAEYILLLDSETNSSFSESTINLKDLD